MGEAHDHTAQEPTMTSTTTRTEQLDRLAALIKERDEVLEMEIDAEIALGEAFHLGELDLEHPDDQAYLDEVEAGIAGWTAKRSHLETSAAQLALECVPVLTIFALPTWLRTEMFGPQ